MQILSEKQAIPIEKNYYTVQDVMEMQGCKRSKASNVINGLNRELEEQGYLPIGRGKVVKNYYDKRFGINEKF